MESIRNYTRRCSTWLSFSIALIRTLVIKYPMDPRFEILSKPRAAFYVILATLILCAPINMLDVYKYDIGYTEGYKCTQHPVFNNLWYGSGISYLFQKNNRKIQKIYQAVDATISKIISCILFPIVTVVLVREIRKANTKRLNMKSSTPNNSKNTSKLVLFLTVVEFWSNVIRMVPKSTIKLPPNPSPRNLILENPNTSLELCNLNFNNFKLTPNHCSRICRIYKSRNKEPQIQYFLINDAETIYFQAVFRASSVGLAETEGGNYNRILASKNRQNYGY
ncbi:hypothetical protein GCK72_021097 [Caenorhabditis remanei]|uniref:G-protein coupled receptors family 1 profile domain-containing protein n=1 Tax=Caenorhabditis remanei TaxID=31234 RepID=A0A6A5GIB8_CAERE|nr:hypothetical protein GCK72_021097 [Caenorhabditis remanei]KAF1754534.1 hypothetical protein GCK72_021097 [Caenorhabditis remanei]